jgi:hypothetical protein
MRLDRETVSYFKSMSEETGIPYQSLINLYLRDSAVNQRNRNEHAMIAKTIPAMSAVRPAARA